VRRRYDNRLRAEHAEETRQRILAALAAQLAAGRQEFSLSEVAEQAGVSLRTLHHHFPNAESRVAALAEWIDAQVGIVHDGPASVDDIGPYAARMAEAFFRNEHLLRAQMAAGIARQVRRQRRRQREDRLRRVIGEAVPEPRAAARVAATLAWIISADAACVLKDRFGLGNDEVARVMTWATRVLTQAACKGDVP